LVNVCTGGKGAGGGVCAAADGVGTDGVEVAGVEGVGVGVIG
jgi:hypothetical protein